MRVNNIECTITLREVMKHLVTIPYDEDIISLDEALTNKYYILHVLVELCFLKTMGYKIGEQTFKKAELEDIWKAHLRALDIELSYALENGDKEWVLKRLEELEGFLEEKSLPDEVRIEILLMLNKWSRMRREGDVVHS